MSQALVRSRDVHRLWELMGEARELRGRDAQKLHAVRGVMSILDVTVGSLLRTAIDDDEQRDLYAHEHVFDLGWASDRDRELVWNAFRVHGWSADPVVRRVVESSWRAPGTAIVRRSEDVLARRDYQEHPIHYDVFGRCHLDHTLYANVLFADPHVRTAMGAGLGLKRAKGDRPFSDEDRNLVELFIAMSDWLWMPDPLAAEASLSRRERETLQYLVDGASLKEVAAHLGISRHTVDGYVKAIHKAFGVRSRGELLARYAAKHRRPLT